MPSAFHPHESFVHRSKLVRGVHDLTSRIDNAFGRHASENLDVLEEINDLIDQLKTDFEALPAKSPHKPLTTFRNYI